jgi:hypothetical protein
MTKEDDYNSQIQNLDFSIGMSCISISRYLTDNFETLSMNAVQQIMERNDYPLLLISILEKRPWIRKGIKSEKEIWDENSWAAHKGTTMKLCKMEGQIWISIFNIVMHDKARKSYELNSHRRDELLKVLHIISSEST